MVASKKKIKELDTIYLEELFKAIMEKINENVLDSWTEKIVINDIEIVNITNSNLDYEGLYYPNIKKIKIYCELGSSTKELIEIFIHELTHAYQHQLIPYYYLNIIRGGKKVLVHDKVFNNIEKRFTSTINKLSN